MSERIQRIIKGKPQIINKYMAKGQEMALIQYDDGGFNTMVQLPTNSNIFNQIFKTGKIKKKKVKKNYKSLSSQKLLGQLINDTYTINPIQLSVNNISKIMILTREFINLSTSKLTLEGGHKTIVKYELQSKDIENLKFKTVLINSANDNDIKKRLYKEAGYHHDTINYSLDVRDIIIIIAPLSTSGGCSNKLKNVIKKLQKSTINLVNPKSKNNNCLIMCFVKACGLKGNSIRPDKIRLELGLELNTPIHIDDVHKVAAYFKRSYILINQCYTIIRSQLLDCDKDPVKLFLYNGHYMYQSSVKHYKMCPECDVRLLAENTTHKCNIKTVNYKKRMVQDKKMVKIKDITEKKCIDYNDVVHFDLETFQEDQSKVPFKCGSTHENDEREDATTPYDCGYTHKDEYKQDNRHKPYACGYIHQGNYKQDYGKGCIENFIDYITSLEKTTISAYNGSGFDFYFLINKLTERNIPINNIILNCGKVMSFTFGEEKKENKVFDVYLFIMSSLDSACKDFKIKNAKTSFDHSKMKTWDDVELYRPEVEPYLKLDVLALEELFTTFNDMIYTTCNVNITSYCTLSHMGYVIFTSLLEHNLELPDLPKYEFIRKAVYGGRTTPHRKEFKTKHYDDVINGKMSYEELLKTNDFIFNGDITSLYPHAMKAFKYPTGESKWSDKPEEEFKNNKIGFYEIEFEPPKNIRYPILPRKHNMGIRWSVEDGKGIYASADIKTAIKCNYKIKFINKCLIYEGENDVFSAYIDRFYKMKEDSEREGNPCKRAIAKLLLNSLYGKTLQRAIFNTSNIVNDYGQFLDFTFEYDLTDLIILNNHKVMVSGSIKDVNKESRITKPSQLGPFVLAYSREVMTNYALAIDPSLKSNIFTYCDTDSMHISGKNYKKLLKMGMIKTKANAQLGFMCSDIKKEGIIIYEKNLQPKCYRYEYINNINEIKLSDEGTLKAKGIPGRVVKSEFYDKDEPSVVEFKGLKKKHRTLTSKDKKQGINHFSICNISQSRTFGKSKWSGMKRINNDWYPHAYEFEESLSPKNTTKRI